MAIQKGKKGSSGLASNLENPGNATDSGGSMERIEAVRSRLDTTAHPRPIDSPLSSEELLTETVELLHATIEELRVANETLGAKNDEIAKIYQSVSAERQRYKD